MPQIPVFENNIDVTPGPAPQANPAAFAAPGEALAHLGQAMSAEMLDFEKRYSDGRLAIDASDRMTSGHQSLGDSALKWSKTPDRAAAQAGFKADASKIVDDILAPINDPDERALVGNHLRNAATIYYHDVGLQAFAHEASASVGDLTLQLNALSHQYAQAGSKFEREQILATAQQAIVSRTASGYMDGDAGARAFIGFRGHADAADAMRDIDADPSGALSKLNDEANYPNLDEFERARLIARADSKSQRLEATGRGELRSRFDDNLASLQETGEMASPMSEGELRAAFPSDADEMLRKLNMAGGLYQAREASVLTSPDQDRALLDKWQPKGAGFADQAEARSILEKSLDQKYTALRRDSAAYVLSASPEIAGLFQKAASDPAAMRPALAALDAAYDKLALPANARPLLSQDAAAKLAGSISAAPDQAQSKLQGLQSEFGDYWPRAWRDIVQIGKLPAAYQSLGYLDNSRDAAQLARWLGQAQSGKSESDLLGPKSVTAIKNTVRADPAVQSLIASLGRSGSSPAQTGGIVSAIENLAFAKSYFDHDPNAAQHAADAFTAGYEFMPDGGARVPKDRFDQVKTAAGALLDGLTLDRLAVPPIYGKPGMPKPEEFLDLLKSSPTWITSPHADALWLMDPYGRIVRERGGAPLAVPFAPAAKGP